MIYLGIDPGASGGIAALSDGHVMLAEKMPDNPHELASMLRGAGADDAGHHAFAVLERVSAMPKQGVSSTFKFGTNYGMVQGVLAAVGIPYELVTPTVWQKAMGCLSKGDKNVTKAAALRRFPDVKVTHAIADSLLLADFARRTYVARYRMEAV
jgi:crossover junction endodeoxyribonuclease RuvC